MFLSLVLSLNRLAKASSSKAQENKEVVITDRHIKMVAKVERYKLALKSTSLIFLLLLIVVLDALRLVAKWLKHEPKPQVQVSPVTSQGKYFCYPSP